MLKKCLFFLNRRLFLSVGAILFLLGGVRLPAGAQQYNFAHYDIENGLVQSQIQKIYQDSLHYMWFGTLGGVSRFDGREFRSYTKSDGLGKNMAVAMLRDRSGRIWVGSEDGVSCIYGGRIINIKAPADAQFKLVRSIVEDPGGRIVLTLNSRLCFIRGNKINFSHITSPKEYVTALTKGKNGSLYAAVYGQGIFSHNGKKWVKIVSVPEGINISRIVFDRKERNTLYLLSMKALFISDKNGLRPFRNELLETIEEPLTALEQDEKGFLWLGTNNGAYWLKPGGGVIFNAGNGFSNAPVRDIYRDAENNIWIATDGAGAYKFDGGVFVTYNTFNGFPQIIMSMAKDSLNRLWMGTSSGGLIRFDGRQFSTVVIPAASAYSREVISLYNDRQRNIYAGAMDGLWKYDGNRFDNILSKFMKPKTAKAVVADRQGTLWIGAPAGCFYYENGKIGTVEGIDHAVSSIIEVGKDSILAATNRGVFLIRGKTLDRTFRLPAIENSLILCMLNYRGTVLAGTFGDGLFVIDIKKRRSRAYNMKQGLLSNDIYSLAADSLGYVWSGTGKGVNRLTIDPATLGVGLANAALPNSLIECNQGAIMNLDGKIWIGTTKGLYVYETRLPSAGSRKPVVNLQSVKIVNQSADGKQEMITYEDDAIPTVIHLGYRQNRVLISFTGLYLTDPQAVSYQYRLRGLDDTFNQPIKTNMIDLSPLLPGTYTFEVKAIASGGAESAVRAITFIITPPFYQTLVFRILAIVLLVVMIIGVQYYLTYQKARQKRILREIKRDEQLRIRRQTAEDFHDDIGNKLTRIAVLSDLLNKQIPEGESGQKNLVKQIKDNAATLYSGTKDILWALDPQSDNIGEIISYVRSLGADLFGSCEIPFSFVQTGVMPDKKLPMEYSRNISMIMKESFHNILKHAEAGKVKVTATIERSVISISICDDGKGFVPHQAKKGRGLNNMKMRAERISGRFDVRSVPGSGTCILLTVPLNGDYKEIIPD